jgi:hypothetical protein
VVSRMSTSVVAKLLTLFRPATGQAAANCSNTTVWSRSDISRRIVRRRSGTWLRTQSPCGFQRKVGYWARLPEISISSERQ